MIIKRLLTLVFVLLYSTNSWAQDFNIAVGKASIFLSRTELDASYTTGGSFTLTPPSWANHVRAKLWGPGGGGEITGNGGNGGGGGFAKGDIPLNGSSVILRVGTGGGAAPNGSAGHGGGGYTGVFFTSETHGNSRLVAGGGGGGGGSAGGCADGGGGGGTTGGDNQDGSANGGTQSAGGTGGSGPDGSALAGGSGTGGGSGGTPGGGDGQLAPGYAGGGSGYYGGEGGAGNCGAAGGAGYSHTSNTESTLTQGSVVTPANTGDVDYVSPKGEGGDAAPTTGEAGQGGMAVIYWVKK